MNLASKSSRIIWQSTAFFLPSRKTLCAFRRSQTESPGFLTFHKRFFFSLLCFRAQRSVFYCTRFFEFFLRQNYRFLNLFWHGKTLKNFSQFTSFLFFSCLRFSFRIQLAFFMHETRMSTIRKKLFLADFSHSLGVKGKIVEKIEEKIVTTLMRNDGDNREKDSTFRYTISEACRVGEKSIFLHRTREKFFLFHFDYSNNLHKQSTKLNDFFNQQRRGGERLTKRWKSTIKLQLKTFFPIELVCLLSATVPIVTSHHFHYKLWIWFRLDEFMGDKSFCVFVAIFRLTIFPAETSFSPRQAGNTRRKKNEFFFMFRQWRRTNNKMRISW